MGSNPAESAYDIKAMLLRTAMHRSLSIEVAQNVANTNPDAV
jgi:hypothetical protein